MESSHSGSVRDHSNDRRSLFDSPMRIRSEKQKISRDGNAADTSSTVQTAQGGAAEMSKLLGSGLSHLDDQYLRTAMRHVLPPQYRVPINWSEDLSCLISRGKYHVAEIGVERYLTEEVFPREKTKGKRRPRFYVEYFLEDLTTEEVVQRLNSRAKRPATIHHALAFGIDCPERLIGGRRGVLHILQPFTTRSGQSIPYIIRWSGTDSTQLGWFNSKITWPRLTLFAAIDL